MASHRLGEGDTAADLSQRFECISISRGKMKYMNPNFSKVQAKMYDYKCDIKLQVAGANFKAHREVLSDASDYFAAMFSHDMVEKEKEVIQLQGISPGGFSVILDYFYHGHVTIDHNNIEDVLEAARFFHVEFLVEACCDYLVHQLCMENYQNVLILADKYWLGDLRSEIFSFLGTKIIELSKEDNFFENLDADLLAQFLREDIYVEADEDFLLELVCRWVKVKEEERKELLLPLLRLIRFPLIDLEALESMPRHITQFPEIEDMVEEAKHYNLNIPAKCLFEDRRFTARGAMLNVAMFTFTEERFQITYRSLTLAHVHKCTEEIQLLGLNVDLSYTMTATIGDYLFATGGYDERVCSSYQMFCFSARTREWLELASMNQARVSHSMCASTDRLFAVGGVDHQVGEEGEMEVILCSAEMYEVADNTWLPLPDLIHSSFDHASSFNDGVLYITGGISGDPNETVPTGTAYRLVIGSEAWEPMMGMLYPRQGHSLTTYNNRLYAIGGYTMKPDPTAAGFVECHRNEMFDIDTNQWTELCPTPPNFGHLLRSVVQLNHKIFLLGNGNLGCYDTEKNSFECLEYFGLFVHKLALLRVAYPLSEFEGSAVEVP